LESFLEEGGVGSGRVLDLGSELEESCEGALEGESGKVTPRTRTESACLVFLAVTTLAHANTTNATNRTHRVDVSETHDGAVTLSTEYGWYHKVTEPTEGDERCVGVLARVLLDERRGGSRGGDPGELTDGSAAVMRGSARDSVSSALALRVSLKRLITMQKLT
jgi:hypothetical protein